MVNVNNLKNENEYLKYFNNSLGYIVNNINYIHNVEPILNKKRC